MAKRCGAPQSGFTALNRIAFRRNRGPARLAVAGQDNSRRMPGSPAGKIDPSGFELYEVARYRSRGSYLVQ